MYVVYSMSVSTNFLLANLVLPSTFRAYSPNLVYTSVDHSRLSSILLRINDSILVKYFKYASYSTKIELPKYSSDDERPGDVVGALRPYGEVKHFY